MSLAIAEMNPPDGVLDVIVHGYLGFRANRPKPEPTPVPWADIAPAAVVDEIRRFYADDQKGALVMRGLAARLAGAQGDLLLKEIGEAALRQLVGNPIEGSLLRSEQKANPDRLERVCSESSGLAPHLVGIFALDCITLEYVPVRSALERVGHDMQDVLSRTLFHVWAPAPCDARATKDGTFVPFDAPILVHDDEGPRLNVDPGAWIHTHSDVAAQALLKLRGAFRAAAESQTLAKGELLLANDLVFVNRQHVGRPRRKSKTASAPIAERIPAAPARSKRGQYKTTATRSSTKIARRARH